MRSTEDNMEQALLLLTSRKQVPRDQGLKEQNWGHCAPRPVVQGSGKRPTSIVTLDYKE